VWPSPFPEELISLTASVEPCFEGYLGWNTRDVGWSHGIRFGRRRLLPWKYVLLST